MSSVRVALIGMGRMGAALDGLAASHKCEVVARLDAHDANDAKGSGISKESLAGADVAIEFTVPEAAIANATRCMEAGVPVVIGTTGWYDQMATLQEGARTHGGRVLWSPNFSPGVQLMLALSEAAGRLFQKTPAFDAHLVETHHTAKLDAPSGTAIAIRDRVERSLGRAVPVTSVRVGAVPGSHELFFDAPYEQIRITHEARDRRVFADGALVAARWLASQTKPGVYTMRDVLGLAAPSEGSS